MSNVQPMAPRKVMTRLEREFLKVSAQFAGSSLDRVEDQGLVDRVNHYLDAGVADAIDAAITRAST
ncbi:hypothetical protein L4684_006475 [Pseudomonas aeruginosa]|nr:hypothetical protein [Pseudomonas aeruginosa]